ncbi:hypothetical protein B566_EDAN004591 [Ephemera danica]|nr:hypothetical protein B566_EDAN004591 [Ephemera danica]
MAEVEGLNGDEMEKLLQFQDLTGIEDINECKETLQSHGWDLEVAVQDTLNVREGRPSVFNQETHRHAQIDDHNVSNEIVPRNEASFIPARGPNQSLLSYVIYIVYNVVTQTVWSFFSFFARFLRPGRRKL